MSAGEICKVIGYGRAEGKPIAKTRAVPAFRKGDAEWTGDDAGAGYGAVSSRASQ
jgi:hypothetical protein